MENLAYSLRIWMAYLNHHVYEFAFLTKITIQVSQDMLAEIQQNMYHV